ncbi:MAG: pyridoxamine 5'-phosphate oxidase family protein [Bacillota bacterium]
MRRKDREMSEKFAFEVCDSCEFAVLSVVDTAGFPYAVAINTVRDGKTLYFHSAVAGKKIDCLKNCGDVCLSFVSEARLVPEKFTTEYKSAVAFGRAVEVLDKDEKIFALRLLCERFAISNMAGFDKAIEESLSHTAIWKVEISEISGKSNIKN